MTALTKLLAGCGAVVALGVAAPAAAQYYPGYGYGGYGSPYGGNVVGQVLNEVLGNGYSYGPNRQVVINQCAAAAQQRLGYNGGRVLGISQVSPRDDGGITVRGVASSGRYGGYGYGYAQARPDLTWRCRTDFRGYVRDLSVSRGSYGYSNSYSPWGGNDYSQFGYRRY